MHTSRHFRKRRAEEPGDITIDNGTIVSDGTAVEFFSTSTASLVGVNVTGKGAACGISLRLSERPDHEQRDFQLRIPDRSVELCMGDRQYSQQQSRAAVQFAARDYQRQSALIPAARTRRNDGLPARFTFDYRVSAGFRHVRWP